ncbi:MAG TPA: beta-ketoacyl-ACP synthase II [Phycicoccus elongatus]|jgi:3-oxoacyl-[acyl-carrier-protein] synthase II|uniref:beta-ketoacyl-ACP synthase II n=1 Tax=Phycicoccus elongatus TaxID=101689 RepID=UPI002BC650A7|nr:beta-ketoacyl-ACP synthase II [Phycicoccus elongatus]MCB9405261.1 beta-ketoacyl-ACP synthase II [Tetrasphaera sp.]HPK11749.1 beta-ketoacyl-ACP synthase II [Phycicoccus elongatus]HPQ72793.1 beta-ketoacyl-ACP synthase II [Phycicoccus elongatus]HRC17703.1 beta-ketoacyl-ACP synthase II [Phycicoccus elongatus]
MSSARRVVITGLGATTPLGGSFADTWDGLLAGRSGMRTMDFPWVEEFEMPAKFAALLHTSPEEVLSKVECRRMDPSTQYAMVAAKDAWADAGAPDVDPIRFGVAIGTGMGGLHTLLGQWDILREKGVRRVFPLAVPMLMPNSPSGTVSLNFGARAGAHTTVSACASGAESMGTAYEMIRAGRADIAIAGGTEAAIHPICFAGFCQMQALSTRNDDPTHASRPYDTSRDGFVMGEGAGVLVLESEEHAKARGARIYAEFGGIGMSADAHHITAPEPEGAGASRAMVEAVERAGLTPADIIHVNAHATSTPVGDVAEANAIRRAFGDAADGMAVSGTKSMTGHLLGAAGALEGVITAKSIAERIAPPTINIVDFDPAISLDVVRDTPRDLPAGDIAALNNSFGFGGHNVALVIKSY